MPSIAIVGTEGSGKTVFITTLAKRFSTDNPVGAFMNPQGRKTIQYVEHVWHTLNNCEWPPSTSPGELFELKWTVHWQDGAVGDIRLVDCAGQDLRLLFADEQAASEGLPDHLQQLASYCRSADIVLLMVNLKDFMGESNDERRTANEWAIKYALDLLSHNGTAGKIAVVFTQTDQYQEVVREHGDWMQVAKVYLPYVYGAHLRNGHISTMAVSSVSDTHVVPDGDGTPRRVPRRNFHSTGLDEMVGWIGTQLRAVTEEQRQRETEQRRQADAQAQQAEQERLAAQRAEQARKAQAQFFTVLKGVGGFILFLVIMIKGCGWLSSDSTSRRQPPPPPPVATVPVPVIESKEENDVGTDAWSFFGHEVRARVVNRGASGYIKVRCKFTQAGHSYEQVETALMPAGWGKEFTLRRFADLSQSDGTVTTEVSAEPVGNP